MNCERPQYSRRNRHRLLLQAPPRSRASQARALAQSRRTVRGSTPRAVAVSCSLKPPKNRQSTTLRDSPFLLTQSFQALIEGEHQFGLMVDPYEIGLELFVHHVAATLDAQSLLGLVEEDLAHGGGGDGEEMLAMGIDLFIALSEAQVRFVNQSRGAEGGLGCSSPSLAASDLSQGVVDLREEFVQGLLFAQG